MKIIIYLFTIVIVVVLLSSYWTNEKYGMEDDGIDAVIYINLENRADRKRMIIEELERTGMDMGKVHKISGVYVPKNGHKGCVQSHILALELASLNNWNRILVLEDDATIVEPLIFKERIKTLLQKMDENDWDVLLLGVCKKEYDSGYLPINIDYNRLKKITSATCSHAYIVNGERYRNKLLNLFRDSNKNMSPERMNKGDFEPHALDQRWKNLQSTDNWFCLEEDLVLQRDSWSTTETNNFLYNY